MPRVRWSICVAVGLLFSLPAHGQDPAMPNCAPALGGNYDAQPPQEKQARRVRYANCWRVWAERGVGRAYGTIGQRVSGYERSLRDATYGVIRAEADTETRLQLSQQQTELAELERRYEEEGRAILAQATPQNRAETNRKRAELLARTRAETGALQQKHAADNAELQAAIRSAFLRADEEIARRVDDDRANLAEQNRTKLRYIDSGFGSLANAAPGQSIVEFENEQQSEDNGMTAFFSRLQGLFVFVSKLIGKEDPADDPEPAFIAVGIRG
jgi:hypothetical protein